MSNANNTTLLRTLLLKWYQKNARDLPWRSVDTTPYEVLVSETMLQQTQAQRIAELFPIFLESYPTVNALATASNAQILKSWKGLGYNSRALRLRDAAREIVSTFNGVVPNDVADLQTLPGVGPYTSSAIASFAYKQPVVVVDVNVHRVYSRWMKRRHTTIDLASSSEIETFAEEIVPRKRADEWHHAVMDLGSTICTARAPSCTTCPLQEQCPSAHSMKQVNPAKRKEPQIRNEPRRIWRGRIVDELRNHDKGLTKKQLVKTVFGPATTKEEDLIEDVLSRLQKDGIVSIQQNRVSLAKG